MRPRYDYARRVPNLPQNADNPPCSTLQSVSGTLAAGAENLATLGHVASDILLRGPTIVGGVIIGAGAAKAAGLILDGLSLGLDQAAGNSATFQARTAIVLSNVLPGAGARAVVRETAGKQVAKKLGKDAAMIGLVKAPPRNCVLGK